MSVSPRLNLPLIAAAQAQKHVTHNEALMRLDAAMNASILATRADPPATPQEGTAYLVSSSPSGGWSARADHVAVFQNAAWVFIAPFDGLTVFDSQLGLQRVYSGGAWQTLGGAAGEAGADSLLAQSAFGAKSWHKVIDAELSGLSGAFGETAAIIPSRAIVLCVSSRTVDTVTGAVSYDCGIDGEPAKFGGSLGSAAGSSNLGVIGPTAFYSPAAIRLTANGGSFTGGTVRLAVHCFLPEAPAAP
ncbi:uncharacterized protein DUF2793 [Roseibium hamelinense]|uniref:Uncharacterized protein DUF2793 n=1 Tax=Roseibium hamelinense TaxID=150831 RepID=A0A562T744_9HYPH|nr:DUF2793 domain-containing protein [Roseibium hamelinense]MTI43707.1 DUF2793 domain-containing protein [Roseibium hamelinense]TWI89389.1 uncharacterized protein DUF2793 [Roseibium hamelinense]